MAQVGTLLRGPLRQVPRVSCTLRHLPTRLRSRNADRPGHDALVQARAGLQYEQPGWRDGPIFLHFPAPSMATCFLLAIGVTSALRARQSTGRGQWVETSLYQGALAYTTMLWHEASRAGPGHHAMLAKTNPPGVHQTSLYECADGWMHAATMNGLAPKMHPAGGCRARGPRSWLTIWTPPQKSARRTT